MLKEKIYIRVMVTPGAKREKVIRIKEGVYAVQVKEDREKNQANTRVRELVAKECRVTPAQVRLHSGHRSPRKLFVITK